MRRGFGFLTAAVFVILFSAPAWAHTVLDTITTWNGTTYVQSFGVSNTATYGQVITVPATDTVLKDFSFEMNLPSTVIFRGEVYAWDGTKATGPSLYESAPAHTSGSGNFELITFTIPNGVALKAGQQYVIFASTSKDQATGSGTGSWGRIASGTGFYYINNGSDSSQWTASAWTNYGSDLAYRATFDSLTNVPAMNEWGMIAFALLAGLSSLFFLRRSKKSQS